MNQDLTPKQQASEAIRQSETILIITGQRPNIDQAASVLALSAVLRKFGKNVTSTISDPLPQQMNFLNSTKLETKLIGLRKFVIKVDATRSEPDQVLYERENDTLNLIITPSSGDFKWSDVSHEYGAYTHKKYDLAIVLGVPTRARIDAVYAANASLFDSLPIVNLDYHRSNENYGAINLIEPTASSLSEMLVALAESLQNGIVDEEIATSMLTGLMASTDRFTAAHTTAKSLTVAAQLMAAGAKQPTIVRSLFRDSRAAQAQERRESEQRTVRQELAPRQDSSPHQAMPIKYDAPAKEAPVVAERIQTPIVTATPIETVLPQAILPSMEPIIEPSHIELLPEVAEEQLPMADFASAVQVLQENTSHPTESTQDQKHNN
jgi:nanoRNase/pAp phosphatase (c-di-AMP/oligoRNAs hydrolase)